MKRALPYIISAAVGATITVIYICATTVWNAASVQEVMLILCNAFFVPGAVLLAAGVIVIASNGGAFYLISYVGRKFLDLFKPRDSEKKYKDYHDFIEKKSEKKLSFAFLLIVGGAFAAVSLIFLILYYTV